jgi:DNA-binding CsgD family transcriptional regulator
MTSSRPPAGRRGRPPHPDVLTPREWEVLTLLREGLPDQAIADRLDISLDGAKYHVREILSKLGVASRQEAAAWQPETPAPARRWLVLPLAARIAGALVMVAAVAGLGLLAIGVILNSDEAEPSSDLSALPESETQPTFTRDQMLVLAAHATPEDTRAISLAWTTLGGAMEASGMQAEIPGSDLSSPAWLVRADAVYDPCGVFPSCGPFVPPDRPQRTPNVRCHPLFLIFHDGDQYAGGMTEGTDGDNCPPADQMSRDVAVMLAARDPGSRIGDRLPEVVDAREMSLQSAASELPTLAGSPSAPDSRVWVVRFTGHLYLSTPAPSPPSTPEPTSCQDIAVVIDATTRKTLISVPQASGTCSPPTEASEGQAIDIARQVARHLMGTSEPQLTSLIQPVQSFWIVTFTGRFPPPEATPGHEPASPPPGGYCGDIVVLVYSSDSTANRAWYRTSFACN